MIQEKWELDQAFEENLSGIVVDLNDIGNAANEVGYYLYDRIGTEKKNCSLERWIMMRLQTVLSLMLIHW